MKLYVCVGVCERKRAHVIAIKRAQKEKDNEEEEKTRREERRHIWCALRHNLMYSDLCNVQYTTYNESLHRKLQTCERSISCYFLNVISLFLISVSIFLDLYES